MGLLDKMATLFLVLWGTLKLFSIVAASVSVQFTSVQSLSHVQLFATPWIAASQASLSITISRVHSNSRPSSRWCHPAISSSVIPFPPAPNPSQHQGLFQWVNSSHEVAKILEFQLEHHSFQRNPRADLICCKLLMSSLQVTFWISLKIHI